MTEFNPGGAASLNQAVKLRYEANADTNVFSDAEKAKLGNIAPGATLNAPDAELRDRAGHTGTQPIATVAGLEAALDGKQAAGAYAAAGHGHALAEVSGLGAALAGKAPSGHGHGIGEVAGLQAVLDGKQPAGSYAPVAHAHAVVDVSGLQAVLDGKQPAGSYAPAGHSHAVAEVTGLQAALDGKQPAGSYAAAGHGHSAAAIADFAEAVDDRVAALLSAGPGVSLTYNDAANTLTVAAAGASGGGDVLGPAAATDGAVVRFDGATGKLVEASPVQIADDGSVRLPHASAPGVPGAGTVGVFGARVGGRMMPAFVGPSALSSALQPLLARNKVAWANPLGNGTSVTQVGISLTATGTGTAANVATTNIHAAMRRIEYAVSTAATSAVAGWRSAIAQFHRGAVATPYGGFFFVCRFGKARGAAANATMRGFTGLSSLTSAPTDANPSTAETNALGVGCDSGDTTYQIIARNGGGTAARIDTGIPKAVADASEMYELVLFTAPQEADTYYQFTRLGDGLTASGVFPAASLPADTVLLAPRGWYSVGGTSSVIGYALASLYIETDY